MTVGHLIDPESILFFDRRNISRDEALTELVGALFHSGKLQDKEEFFLALKEREKIISTGIGMGIAIPHAKTPSIKNFFLAIGISKKGIEWGSLDKAPVRLIFLIGGPDDSPSEYLKILSYLTKAIKQEELRKKLLSEKDKEKILQLFL